MSLNLGNAILILGCLYLSGLYENELLIYLLILLSILTWGFHSSERDLQKEYYRSLIRLFDSISRSLER